jgi:hypothetical protein
MKLKPKKLSSLHSWRGSQVEYRKHSDDLFFDCEECVHREFVPSGHTVEQHYYRVILHRIKAASTPKNIRKNGGNKRE